MIDRGTHYSRIISATNGPLGVLGLDTRLASDELKRAGLTGPKEHTTAG